jgi:predicted GH43/DUF377 family glycosyl hydrolase
MPTSLLRLVLTPGLLASAAAAQSRADATVPTEDLGELLVSGTAFAGGRKTLHVVAAGPERFVSLHDGGRTLHLAGGGAVQIGAFPNASATFEYFQWPLLNSRLSYTVDLGAVGCSCNAALYFFSGPGFDRLGRSNKSAGYCGANAGKPSVNTSKSLPAPRGNYCPELDVLEANRWAAQSTPHICNGSNVGAGFYPMCDHHGCSSNSYRSESTGMCPSSACTIDSRLPFEHSISFPVDASTKRLSAIRNTFTQGAASFRFSTCSKATAQWTGGDAALYLSRMGQNLKAGMNMDISLWGLQHDGMSWLDGATACNVTDSNKGNCDVSASVVSFSNITLDQLVPSAAIRIKIDEEVAGAATGTTAPTAATYTVSVTSYPQLPVIDHLVVGQSPWDFPYNPAYLPPSAQLQTKGGLLVRCQDGNSTPGGHCGAPTNTTSVLAFAPVSAGGAVGALTRDSVVLSPANTSYEYTSEDPRVLLHGGTYFMTYTANGDPELAEPPLNRHQGIATCTRRCHLAGQWTRRCTAEHPCLIAGVKSGAMVPSSKPGGTHYMLAYDLRKVSKVKFAKGLGRDTVLASSPDLIHWTLLNRTLLPRRPAMWDAGLIEPGPPPLRLSDGNWLFFYNGATVKADRQYHVGFAILDGEDPTKVLQRSETPVLSWFDRKWMVGNSLAPGGVGNTDLCYTPTVVFCNAARSLGGDSFQLWFGGADAVVGTATVHVSVESF